MNEFLKRELWFVSLLLIFTLLSYAIHWYLDFQFFANLDLIIPIFTIYIFNFITVLIVYSVINYRYFIGKIEILPLFLGATLFKMVLAIIFLLPILLKPNENATLETLNFFIPYFFYLAFEIIAIMHLMKEK